MTKEQLSFPYIAVRQAEDRRNGFMSATFDKITISHDDVDCYFHLLGENRKYLDLESLALEHPEVSDYIEQHRYELQRGLYQLRELIETHETVSVN